ncbi:MAG TPA: hypothetical protein VGY53_12055 [Isosphaeraceae bacterium]|jgi:hypothetical protein|nr:hypothetical protein [Isosphaeraceae bacterium]
MRTTNDPLKQWLFDFLASRLAARQVEGRCAPQTNQGVPGTTSPRTEVSPTNDLAQADSARIWRPE